MRLPPHSLDLPSHGAALRGPALTAPPPSCARLICPPYDVIAPEEQAQLAARSPHNAVHLELPVEPAGQHSSRYAPPPDLAAWRERACCEPTQRRPTTCPRPRSTYGDTELTRRDLLAALGVEPWSTRVGAAARAHHGRPQSRPPRSCCAPRT